MKATHITSRTMIGVNMEKFPVKRGNCFSVKTEEGHEYRIVNFSVENLEELNHRGVKFPIIYCPDTPFGKSMWKEMNKEIKQENIDKL